ncbi:TonB-dependent receptor domain-containing protein [Parahaliea mediterranea]|uniref:TonB-dependent receptor n=1 Tax=Parahaliea mediterranea TaxID=651086 RepID=A0A939IKQ7_9GAMM|nr:TonB-dependent receptor [Parahaliea mediterranea]MBN7799019.1 TonB-dependent receptor [Parahaliea mediterranea]
MAVSAALGMSAAAVLPSVANAQEELLVEEVVVTGSRIQKTNLVTSSPVTQVDADEFKFQGTTRVEDLMKNLPQVYSNQNASQSNGATGTATLNLRNLGDERTLVLINGRRMPAGSPLQGGVGADINQIPGALIKRVEVLTGGASATYGSDAVAGVVNFIMVDDFEGIKLDYQYSQYQHDNDNSRLQRIVGDAGFPFPDGSNTDGDIQDISLVLGGNFDNGRGNITAYASYREIDGVLQSERDYSACALNDDATGCFGSGTSAEGTFLTPGNGTYYVDGDQFIPGSQAYNYGPLNYYQRPDERYTAGAFGRYSINEHVEAYTELSFMDNQTNAQIAPSGSFFLDYNVSPDNPFLSDQQRDILFGDPSLLNDNGTAPVTIGRRNVEGGPRNQDLRHTTFRGVFGARGDINDTWRYDVYGLYAEVSMENTYNNDLSNAKLANAVDAVIDPETGDITCRSVLDGRDPNCVPWNPWQTGGVEPGGAATEYLALPLFARGTTTQKVISGYVAGSLGDYGIQLPTADSGVEIILGAEYRKETLNFNPDEGFRLGLGAGQGGATNPVNGEYDVNEFFLEASVPLVEGKTLAEEVVLDLGYRYSDYSTDTTTDTYGISGSWAFNNSFKLRASYQRAVRAPNIQELFLPQGFNLFDMAQDPCTTSADGNPPTATLEQCMRSGITAETYNNYPDSFAGQYNYLQGGNTELSPEEADTYSIGFIWSPEFIDGLTMSVDWYQIEIEQGIEDLEPEFILNQCLAGDDAMCASVNRGPRGDLWIGSDVNSSGHIVALQDNLAKEEVEGYDVIFDYSLEVGGLGTLMFNNTMSIIETWDTQQASSAPVDDCKGNWGGNCGYPTPDFRNNFRATWLTPWGITGSLAWRHIGDVTDLNGNLDLDDTDYFDVSAVWDVLDNTSLRAGINNVLDEEPPIAGDAAGPSLNGNGNVFPGMYDALGRYMFLGVSVEF